MAIASYLVDTNILLRTRSLMQRSLNLLVKVPCFITLTRILLSCGTP
jgi:hypothetical protein